MEGANFGGWATKSGLLCSDGITIGPGAFKGQDGQQVPLVYQHDHNGIDKVLGHAILEEREGGTYAWVFLNDSPGGIAAKKAVEHGDLKMLSIWANDLVKRGAEVVHGKIRELSLVLAGANPGAMIDNVIIRHSADDEEELEGQAIITTGETIDVLSHADDDGASSSESDKGDDDGGDAEVKTVQDIIDTMDDDQKNAFYMTVGQLTEEIDTLKGTKKEGSDTDEKVEQSATSGEAVTGNADGSDAGSAQTNTSQEGSNNMSGTETQVEHSNVFEKDEKDGNAIKHVLTAAAKEQIFADAKRNGSMADALSGYCLQHDIEQLEIMFPDAKTVGGVTPQWLKRKTEWVEGFMSQTTKTPFSRIKNLWADITEDEARAKGYIKGTLKKEEFFQIAKRVTIPTTVYKKQALDRDDIIDISDFDVVAWLKMEMRVMLDEEIARAALIGDGRDPASADKIDEQCIRPIAKEHELFTVTVNVADPALSRANALALIDDIVRARALYKGSGQPTMYTSESTIASLLLLKDTLDRDLYTSIDALAMKLRFRAIVAVEVMETEPDIVAVIVNPVDYTFGANKGGQVTLFDQFDIDFNKEKYLIETRVSGSLTKLKSALVLKKFDADDDLIVAGKPAFNPTTGVVTIPTDANVAYFNARTGAAMADGSTVTLTENQSIDIRAVAATGFFFKTSEGDSWTFRRNNS